MTKNKITFKKFLIIFAMLFFAICTCFAFAGCSQNIVVTNIEKSNSTEQDNTYTIYYSNGQTSTIKIANGKDGKDVSIDDIYDKYVETYGEIAYADFLKLYFNNTTNNSKIINQCLQSCLKVYTEFYTTTQSLSFYGIRQIKSVSVMCGSAIIYQIAGDYTYILTNYHVVYNANANSDNGGKIAKKIVGYLYGSEGAPSQTTSTINGYAVYDYGDYGVEFEYVGGSIDYDIAVLKVATNNLKAINENIVAVDIAESYYVGETAIAIGNPENQGISVSQGVVSVDNEYITLNIDGNSRYYRSIRMDTAIYGGSSGGGLFNSYGELIGLTNAGDQTDQNINYAIPLQIVVGVANNIINYCDGLEYKTIKTINLGLSVDGKNSKYVYDDSLGYGNIVENVVVSSITNNSIAFNLGLQENDIIKSIFINETEYTINRYFEIGDIILNIRATNEIKISYIRNNLTILSNTYTVSVNDIK